MSWRDNWLLALPPVTRLLPPLLLTFLGGCALVWLHDHAPDGFYANLTPLVWCVVGAGFLLRSAQSLLVSATAFGMAWLAASGALGIALGADRDLWHAADRVRIALWGLLAFLALPAAVWEALCVRLILARRFYFAAIALFFVEQGLRHSLGVVGHPSQAVFLFLVSLVALFGVYSADRTLADTDRGPADESTAAPVDSVSLPTRRVHYLDETPSAGR